MATPGANSQRRLPRSRTARIVQAGEAHVVHVAAAWSVRMALDASYHLVTGHGPPSARDRDVPVRRILAWTAISAAALAVTNVVVDRAFLPSSASEAVSQGSGSDRDE